jgi:hypothetical protein
MQTVDEEKKKQVITYLELVKKRPMMFIGSLDAALMDRFINGFHDGCLLMKNDEGAFGSESKKMSEMREQYILGRGWYQGCKGLVVELRKKGLSEEEIIQGLVEIEIEVWKNI